MWVGQRRLRRHPQLTRCAAAFSPTPSSRTDEVATALASKDPDTRATFFDPQLDPDHNPLPRATPSMESQLAAAVSRRPPSSINRAGARAAGHTDGARDDMSDDDWTDGDLKAIDEAERAAALKGGRAQSRPPASRNAATARPSSNVAGRSPSASPSKRLNRVKLIDNLALGNGQPHPTPRRARRRGSLTTSFSQRPLLPDTPPSNRPGHAGTSVRSSPAPGAAAAAPASAQSPHAGAALFPASAGLTAEERAAFTPEEKSQLFEAFGLAAEETVVRRCATVNLTVRPKLRRMLFCAMIAMPLHCSSPDQPLSFARRNRYSLWPKTTGWTMQ